jgi:pyridoxamine 5'-phosphate oxidase-like protein
MRWAEFEEAAPELAALGRERIERFGFVFIGTLRKDGGPRINPVEAHFVAGELAHALMKRSVKALDLLRDPRAYLHTPVLDAELGRPGEFKLRARARPIEDDALRSAVCDAVETRGGWRPPDDWHFFTIDVQSAVFHEYDQRADVQVVKRWTPERGYEALERRIV